VLGVFAKRTQSAELMVRPFCETKPIRGMGRSYECLFCETNPILSLIAGLRFSIVKETFAAAIMIATPRAHTVGGTHLSYPIPLLSCGKAELDSACVQTAARGQDFSCQTIVIKSASVGRSLLFSGARVLSAVSQWRGNQEQFGRAATIERFVIWGPGARCAPPCIWARCPLAA
jgi:hypothetical protein